LAKLWPIMARFKNLWHMHKFLEFAIAAKNYIITHNGKYTQYTHNRWQYIQGAAKKVDP